MSLSKPYKSSGKILMHKNSEDTFFCGVHCQRCNDPHPPHTTMSRFNTDRICPTCEEKERVHPKYQEAVDAEIEQVKCGNYNYKGIAYYHRDLIKDLLD